MTAPLAIAPFVTSYTARTPYITPAEYMNAPTAVDSSNLDQGGNQQQNQSELVSVIGRASAMADQIVFGAQGCLAATVDIDGPQRYRVNRYGQISFRCNYRPVLEVRAVSVGWSTSTMSALLPTQSSDIEIHQSGIVVIPTYAMNPQGGIPPWTGFGVGVFLLVQMTYVNGYPNTTLSATATAGSTTITLNNVTGIYPGSVLTIYDDYPGSEPIVVAPSYAYGSTTVPLVSALQWQHSSGISVSALPPSVKQAVIHLTSVLIKTRGNLAMVMGSINAGASSIKDDGDGAVDDLGMAYDLLEPFKRVR